MREDIGIRPSENEVKKSLLRLSNEISNVINSEEAINDVTKNIKQWPYQIKNFSLKSLLSEGPVYLVDKSVKFEKSKNKSFLKSPKALVEIPQKFETIIEFLMRQETISKNTIKNEFKNMSNDIIDECIENLKKMSVIK
jgi:hypothetical protein